MSPHVVRRFLSAKKIVSAVKMSSDRVDVAGMCYAGRLLSWSHDAHGPKMAFS